MRVYVLVHMRLCVDIFKVLTHILYVLIYTSQRADTRVSIRVCLYVDTCDIFVFICCYICVCVLIF